MNRKEKENLDLIVERYTFKTRYNNSTHFEAILSAAGLAEGILYHDIYGALDLDLVKGWGRSGPDYPQPKEQHDQIAKWNSNWIIPPYEYMSGIRWKPLDGMQQFEIRAEAVKKGENSYEGRVQLVAYVWDDSGFPYLHGERTGCLLDIVNRNRENIISAETGKIAIPMDKNKKEDINSAQLNEYGQRLDIFGFEFPPDEIGDISHRPIELQPINIKKRHQDCAFRDR
jgi:hypothetical protein